ncbi:MAG: ABC transporter permease [Specibacter sp.]
MTIISDGRGSIPEAQQPNDDEPGGFAAYWAAVSAVVGMEMRQRMRSRGWYIMLGIWLFIIALVTWLTWLSWRSQYSGGDFGYTGTHAGPGAVIFEIVLAFVLLFGLLVAPAFSANAVNGDRAGGTLAILQVTLLTPGQILWGKFLASWIAGLAFLVVSTPFLVFGILQGGLGAGHIFTALLMLAVELGVVCALGVGISALANRPLFSIVVTYLVVAALSIGTLIAFGLGTLVSQGTVMANQVQYKNSYSDSSGDQPLPPGITDQNNDYACYGTLAEQEAVRTDRVAWILAMNPFVVVADSIPYTPGSSTDYSSNGTFEMISQAARAAQAGPSVTTPCANGKVAPSSVEQKTPLWPLGLGLQLVVAAGVVALGWRSLRTPAGKLPQGTRVA